MWAGYTFHQACVENSPGGWLRRGLSTQLWKPALGPERTVVAKGTLTSGSRENISLGNEVRISGNDCDTQRLYGLRGEFL